MYLEYFGLREFPFNVTADPAFLYRSRQHREVLSHLLYGIREKKGFIAITGDVGTGKTTICRALLRELDSSVRTALILNPNLSSLQLLQAIVQDFGIGAQVRSKLLLTNLLNQFLIDQLTMGNNSVVIIDEAQNLSMRMLEQVRLLSNLETAKAKLLQLVLVGQPQLRDKLSARELVQLQQRIAVRYHIQPLHGDEIRAYVDHRLHVAGANGSVRFADDAIPIIHEYTHGTPRLINLVCDKALLACYVLKARTVTGEIVQQSIRELEGKVTI